MIPNVIPLYEDELLYSYLVRLARANSIDDLRDFVNYNLRPSFYFNHDYNAVNFDTHGLFCPLAKLELPSLNYLDVVELLFSTSTIQFELPMLTKEMRGRLVNYYLGNYSKSKLSPSIDSPIRRIRYCPECVSDVGNRYYRRAHQLPGVAVCHIHGCPLVEVDYRGNEQELTPSAKALEYAKFTKAILDAGIDCCYDDMKAAVLTRLREMGMTMQDVPAKVRAEGYGTEIFNSIPAFLQSFQRGTYLDQSSFAALLLFAFGGAVDTLIGYLPSAKPSDDFLDAIRPDYDLIGPYRSDIVHLRHRCGQDYYVTPYYFMTGWECPCTYISDDDLFQRIVTKTGDDAYAAQAPFVSLDTPLPFLHKDCGQVTMIRPRNFIFERARCSCESVISRSQVAKKVADLGDFELVEYKNTSSPMTVLHVSKGHTFTTTYHKFLKYPWCKACRPRVRTAEKFLEEVEDLVGQEYTVIKGYTDKDTSVEIRHNSCGRVMTCLPRHFLDGVRCPVCSRQLPDAEFPTAVEALSSGKYRIISKQSANLYTITDGTRTLNLRKQKIIQELTRVTPSPILPNTVSAKFTPRKNNDDKVWDYIVSHYDKESIIFLEDLNIPDVSYSLQKKSCSVLIKDGRLKSVAPGVYVFPGYEPSTDELIKERYICRNGHHIGYWAQPVMAYKLGLTDEVPEVRSIVTNKEASPKGRVTKAFGQQVKLRHGRSEVDDSNYNVLPIMDLITTGEKHIKVNDSAAIIVAFIRDNKLKYEDFESYFGIYPDWVKNTITKLFRTGVWT